MVTMTMPRKQQTARILNFQYSVTKGFQVFLIMSEGPEVKRTADKLTAVLVGAKIVDIYSKRIDAKIKEKILGAEVIHIETFGKNIVISFSSGIFLRNHMMMWGKWRIYDRTAFDQGLAHPPPRSVWRSKKALIDTEEFDRKRTNNRC